MFMDASSFDNGGQSLNSWDTSRFQICKHSMVLVHLIRILVGGMFHRLQICSLCLEMLAHLIMEVVIS